MSQLYSSLVAVHAAVGLLGLTLFWLPVALRKGGAAHRRYGRWFANAMLATAASGFTLTLWWLIDPLGSRLQGLQLSATQLAQALQNVHDYGLFLGMLALLLASNIYHGTAVLNVREERHRLRGFAGCVPPIVLAAAGLAGLVYGAMIGFWLLIIFGGLAAYSAGTALHYIYKTAISPKEWLIEHLSNMFAAGIGAHTAFFLFGANRLLGEFIVGPWQLLPWLLPSLIGTPAIVLVSRHYRRKFAGNTEPAALAIA